MIFPTVGYYTVRLQLLVVLMLTCTADLLQEEGRGEPAIEGACQNLNILMASNATGGTEVILTSTKDVTNSQPISTTIAGRHLPPECQVNHLCGILHFRHPSGTSHYFIPSIHGFVVLSHWAEYRDNRTQSEESPWYSFIGVAESCNPTRAFLSRNNSIIMIACMNLQSRPHGSLYYIHYNLVPNSTGSGWIVTRNTALQTKLETIYKPLTVSEIIHIRGQLRCQERARDNLYFIDDEFILQFPTSDTTDPGFSVSDHSLEDCIGYQSLEHYGNDSLIIHCSSNRTALYDSCVTGRFTYAPDDHIPYPCTNWSTVVYRNGTQLTLDGETQQLPSGDVNYAKCVQGVNSPIFIASSADGVFITRFDGNNFTKITSGNYSKNNDGVCLRPVFSESDLIFATFDSGSLAIINVTEGCTYDPVIARFPIPFQPDLTSVSLGRETYNCSCSAVQNTEPPPTDSTTGLPPTMQTDSTLDISESVTNNQTERAKQPDSTMATHQSEFTFSVMEISPSPSHRAPISQHLLAGLITVAVLVAVLVPVIAAIIVYLVYRHVRSSHVKEKKDFTLNVEFPLQESPDNQHFHKDLGNNAENQGDGGYGSGETPTTISLSESAETASSISGGSECTVSACAEAGPQGGKTHIPSTLPLKCIQIGAQHALEQYQSRTSDNRDKDDMENKVHTFTAEDNNRERDNNHTASLNNN